MVDYLAVQTVQSMSHPHLEAIERLTAACPSFADWRVDDWYFADDGAPLGYLVVVELCAHLLARLEHRENAELESVLAVAESLIEEGDQYASELACVGVVEGLYQSVWHGVARGSLIRPETIRDRLAPQCRAYWNAWDNFCTRAKTPAPSSEDDGAAGGFPK